MPEVPIRTVDINQQLAVVDEDLAGRLQTDFRHVAPRSSAIYNLAFRQEGAHTAYTDEWGIDWRMPEAGRFYYDMVRHPMAEAQTSDGVTDYAWPDAADPQRFAGLRERAKADYFSFPDFRSLAIKLAAFEQVQAVTISELRVNVPR
jgi:hypothetical protein